MGCTATKMQNAIAGAENDKNGVTDVASAASDAVRAEAVAAVVDTACVAGRAARRSGPGRMRSDCC